MARIAAQWFDGLQVQPHALQIELTEEHLHLLPESGEGIALPWQNIRLMQQQPRELRFRLPPRGPNAPDGVLTVPAADFHAALDTIDLLQRQQIVRRLRLRAPLRTPAWLLIALIVVPLCWFLYTRAAVFAHHWVPAETEARLGRQVQQQFMRRFEVWDNPEQLARLEAWTETLRPPDSRYTYRITLVDTPQINALAAPGGELLFFRGLLEAIRDEDELIGVLAHEIAHVEYRHGLQQVMRSLGVIAFMSGAVGGGFEGLELIEGIAEAGGLLVLFSYSREKELEADAWAARRMRQTGYDPNGLYRFLENLYRLSPSEIPRWATLLSTHPQARERLDALRRIIDSP